MKDSTQSSGNPAAAHEERRVEPKSLLISGLHLAALSAFGLAQPLFDLLAKNPEFFAARGSQSEDIVVFAVALVLVPPALLLLVELLAGLAYPPARRIVHLVFVGALAAIIFMQVLRRGADSTAPVLVGAAVLGAAAALAYWRLEPIRSFVTVLSPAPLIFLAIFLFFSDVSKLAFPDEAEARETRVSTDTPIVMVGFDEFPTTSLLDERNRIDPVRYPNFAALAGDATWFRNATGVHDRTTKAYPAILDGKNPVKGSLPIAADHPDNLFTLFGSSHEMNVSEVATTLCPKTLCKDTGREQGFADRMSSLTEDLSIVYGQLALPKPLAAELPSITNTLGSFRGDGTQGGGGFGNPRDLGNIRRMEAGIVKAVRGGGRASEFTDWIRSIRAGPRPTFSWKHVFFPHVPWQYLPSGRRYMTGPVERVEGQAERVIKDEFVIEQTYQRHLLQLGFTDRLLGAMIDQLKEEGIYEKALILLVADHGATFTKGDDRRVVTNDHIQDLAAVPLIIKAPGQRKGRISDKYVRTVDIAPTVADILNIRLPWKTDGVSAFGDAIDRRRTVEMEQGEQATIGESKGKAEVSITLFEEQQAAALERMLGLFGSGRDDPGLYGIGPHTELLGRRLDELDVTAGGGAKAAIDEAGLLRSVNLESDFVPSEVSGRITGRGSPGKRDLAFALNGRVVALGESFSLLKEDEEDFAAMLPESAFRSGVNRLEVLEVTGTGGALRLERLGRA